MSAKVVTDPMLPALNELVHTSLVMTTVAETLRSVTRKLEASDARMAWEVVSRGTFGEGVPESIRSCWIFVIRAGAVTGAERHPNSHQRSFSLIGSGTFELRDGPGWRSHPLGRYRLRQPRTALGQHPTIDVASALRGIGTVGDALLPYG